MKTIHERASDILREWGVVPTEERDWELEIHTRVRFLQDCLRRSGRSSLVLGISGGVDSTAAGKLCQLAAQGLRDEGQAAEFIAVRLPYGQQLDEVSAQAAIDFIAPDRALSVDIKPAVDALHDAVMAQDLEGEVDARAVDFERGNVKARLRMTAQYEIAALKGGLVVGTDHNAEAVTGFFTKWGDGAADLLPLRGLNKRQVRKLALVLGASDDLAHKPATADLEDLNPQRLDEEALGIPYDVIDDFLERKPIDEAWLAKVVNQFEKTNHKRQDLPAADVTYDELRN